MVDSKRMYHRQELLRLNKITYVNIHKAVHLGALPYVICISNTIKHVLVHVLKLTGTQ